MFNLQIHTELGGSQTKQPRVLQLPPLKFQLLNKQLFKTAFVQEFSHSPKFNSLFSSFSPSTTHKTGVREWLFYTVILGELISCCGALRWFEYRGDKYENGENKQLPSSAVLKISDVCWNTTQVSLWRGISFPPNDPLSIWSDKHLPLLKSGIPGCLYTTILPLISPNRQGKSSSPTGMATFVIQPHAPRAFSHLGDRDLTLRSSWGENPPFLTLHNSLLPSPAIKGFFHNFKATCVVIPVTLLRLLGKFSSVMQYPTNNSSPDHLSAGEIINSSHFPAGAEVQEAWNGTFRG